jgi:glycogen operon protein
MYLNGDALDEVDPRGQPLVGDSFLLLMNAHTELVDFVLPGKPFGTDWLVELDTSALTGGPTPRDRVGATVAGRHVLPLAGHSMVVLRRVP